MKNTFVKTIYYCNLILLVQFSQKETWKHATFENLSPNNGQLTKLTYLPYLTSTYAYDLYIKFHKFDNNWLILDAI